MKQWSALEKLIWVFHRIKGGASAIIETITGALPLVLQNAIPHAIVSLTRYGLCTQDGTPTPDAPVDIVCNNGVLKVNRLDLDNVVNGYYWSATGVYIETAAARLSNTIPVKRGDVIAVTTATVRSGTLNIRYNQFDDSGNWVSQTVYAQYSNAPHTGYITIAQDGFFNFSGNYIASQSTYVDWESVVIINTTDPVFTDGTPEVLMVRPGEHIVLSASDFTQVATTDVQTAEFIAVQPGTDYVFSFDMADTLSGVKYETTVKTYNAGGAQLRILEFNNPNGFRSGYFIADSNEVKVKVNIHVKSSSDTMTPADIVSFIFDTQSTSYDPTGKNLFNRLNCVYGKYLSNSGTPTTGGTACYSNKIPVDPNKSYTFSGISSEVGDNKKRVCFYQANDSFISAQESAVTDADAPYSMTFTPPANTAYCRLSLNTADTEVMLEEGSTQTAYEPYIDASWQTASVPMLLSVGNYKDEAEIISGIKTGKVGALVLDGVTDGRKLGAAWNSSYKRGNLAISDMLSSASSVADALCTHFGYSSSVYSAPANDGFCTHNGVAYFSFVEDTDINSATDANAYLAAQYAAGTPVIVVYPLADETTEQTTAQHLVTHEGTNIVDSVANVGPVEAEVKYMTASAQDVLSTLLGMRVTPKDISKQDAEDMIDIITGEDNK